MEQLPGVTLLGPTKDASGRVGVGVALSTPHIRHILVFNPRTSAVLGELSVTRTKTSVLGTQVPKGTVIDFTTFGKSGVTSSITHLPGGARDTDDSHHVDRQRLQRALHAPRVGLTRLP